MGFETALGNLASVSQSLFVNVEVLFRIVAEGFLEAGNSSVPSLEPWEDGSLVLPGVGQAIRE